MLNDNLIYLPIELSSDNCVIVYDKDTLRVYENKPIINSSVNYIDFFPSSHYLSKKGIEYIESEIDCSDNTVFTTAYYNRVDFADILLVFFLILFISYFIISKLLHALFLGFR